MAKGFHTCRVMELWDVCLKAERRKHFFSFSATGGYRFRILFAQYFMRRYTGIQSKTSANKNNEF